MATPPQGNKAIVRSYWEEVVGKGDFNVASQILADDCKLESVDDAAVTIDGRDGINEFVQLLRSATPDIKVTIEDQIAEGDQVATIWDVAGVYQGEIMSMAPTGKRLVTRGISVARVADGKIYWMRDSFTRIFEDRTPTLAFIHRWLWS